MCIRDSYNGDLAHYSTNYWATVNPYRMPGTTETNAKREDGSGQDVLPSGFVGTSKLSDNFASAAMDFTNWNKTLSLHKGWIILNDKVVFLGSDIKNTSTDLASTTIEQRKVDTNNPYRVFVNGKETTLSTEENLYKDTRSVFLESNGSNRNIGYFFLKNSDLKMFQQTQKGAWKDINSSQSEEQ